MHKSRLLELINIETVDHLTYPEEFHELTFESPALEIFTDFKHYKPLIIEKNTNIVEAEQLMKKTHTNLRLVVNDVDEFIGILTSTDIQSENITMLMKNGIKRDEIFIGEVMTPRSEVKAISYEALSHSSIADVIDTLKANGQQHCLVLDTKLHLIRGIIAASDIAKRIHLPISIVKRPTFIEIFRAIRQA